MAHVIAKEMTESMDRSVQFDLSYLSLDRASSALFNDERQRVLLACAVRNRTTGVLYVLDESTIGLHPSNVDDVLAIIRELLADGNSAVVADHDTRVLAAADHLIEIGSGAGADGGSVISQGPINETSHTPAFRIGPHMAGVRRVERAAGESDQGADIDGHGASHLETGQTYTVRPLSADIPLGSLTAVMGVSGSSKTTPVLEPLTPALRARLTDEPLPAYARDVDAAGISRANLIDATPAGMNVCSTAATYSGVLDELRRAFVRTEEVQTAGLKPGALSYNTGLLRHPTCDGTGQITLDVQSLPDVDIECTDRRGSRYGVRASQIRRDGLSLLDTIAMSMDEARMAVRGLKKAGALLETLAGLDLGYLTPGETTLAFSGGKARRLKLISEVGRRQEGTLPVLDEPTIGLHPYDVQVLLNVLQHLIERGATVLVIERDLDPIRCADWVIDMDPGDGTEGGRIVAQGTPSDIVDSEALMMGHYLR